MLDLNFVRANLELVEEKLRARGMDPEALLGNFRELDRGAALPHYPGRNPSGTAKQA